MSKNNICSTCCWVLFSHQFKPEKSSKSSRVFQRLSSKLQERVRERRWKSENETKHNVNYKNTSSENIWVLSAGLSSERLWRQNRTRGRDPTRGHVKNKVLEKFDVWDFSCILMVNRSGGYGSHVCVWRVQTFLTLLSIKSWSQPTQTHWILNTRMCLCLQGNYYV